MTLLRKRTGIQMRMMLVLCNSNYPSDHNFENGQYSTDQLFRCGPGPGESGFVINGYGSNTGNGCRHMLAHPSCCHQREREWRKERKRIEESERVEKEKLWAVSRRIKTLFIHKLHHTLPPQM